MKKLLGAMSDMRTDWTFPVYYATEAGLISELWGRTRSEDPEAVYRKAQSEWDRCDAELEKIGKPLLMNESRRRSVKRRMSELENLMTNLSEWMEENDLPTHDGMLDEHLGF